MSKDEEEEMDQEFKELTKKADKSTMSYLAKLSETKLLRELASMNGVVVVDGYASSNKGPYKYFLRKLFKNAYKYIQDQQALDQERAFWNKETK